MVDNETKQQDSAEDQQNAAPSNPLANAFRSAVNGYKHFVDSIHEINEYVDKKNELDAQMAAGSIEQEAYEEQVNALKEQYFADDASRQALADKAEAMKDWSDEHGVTNFANTISEKVASLKAAFMRATGLSHEEQQTAEKPSEEAQDDGQPSDETAEGQQTEEEKADARGRMAENALSGVIGGRGLAEPEPVALS